MASRTKSFFDQNQKQKPRPGQWHNNKSRAPLGETSQNVTPAKQPIPATLQAKSKLKAFQFVAGDGGETESENAKENDVESLAESAGVALNNEEANRLRPSSVPTKGSSNDPRLLPHANTFPCTPGTRLPLEDLIGDFDDNDKPVTRPEPTPEDHLGWVPHSSGLTPSRKRKRARSSSPSCPNTSSQRHAIADVSPAARDAPSADPAIDLWHRFAGSKPADDSSKLPDFSHIFLQASPRKLETPARSAGFRRWASTGNDWPTSKHKRRRTKTKIGVELWPSDDAAVEFAGKSKVAAMVEQLQESLATQRLANVAAKPAVRIEAPSSSDPLPEVGPAVESTTSPMPAKAQNQESRQQDRPRAPVSLQATNPPTCQKLAAPRPQHEAEMVHAPAVADAAVPAPLHLHRKAPLPPYKRPIISRVPSGGRQYPQRAPVVTSAVVDEFDEFGGDLDLSAEDLAELMTQPPPAHLQPLHQISAHPDPLPQQRLGSRPGSAGSHAAGGRPQQAIVIDEFDDDDEFGTNDIDVAAFAQAEVSATQGAMISLRRSPRKSKSPRAPFAIRAHSLEKQYQRLIIQQVVEGEYTNAKGRRCPEMVALSSDDQTSKATTITLRESWASTPLARGDIVHVTSVRRSGSTATLASQRQDQIIVSDAEGSPLLVVHPDHMLSATSVADSFDCVRKAVLQARIKASGDTSKPMVYGNILHAIFQQALTANRWDDDFLTETVERTVEQHVEGLWELGMQDTTLASEEIKTRMVELAAWARIYLRDTPHDAATIDGRQGEKTFMSISKLIAIEEHIWSPRYGLKGSIDATIEATVKDRPEDDMKRLVLPFEVKTGRATQSPMHMAQTTLYTLLLSDRYELPIATGILYYLESSAMTRIGPPARELRHMVQQRNRIAASMHAARHPVGSGIELTKQSQDIEETGLPGLLRDPGKCGRCYAQASCFTYHALAEGGSADSAGMIDDGKKNHGAIWAEAVGHLILGLQDKTQASRLKAWFVKWDRLLSFEEEDASKLRNEIWTMSSEEREAVGRCFANLVVARDLTSTASTAASSVPDGIKEVGKINRFAYVFVRSSGNQGHTFAEGTQLVVGEPIVISSEDGQWALANGYVVASTRHDITVAVDRKLGNARQRVAGFDAESNQVLRGIMTVGRESESTLDTAASTMLYRIDKDEFSNGLALVRSNLVGLMSSHPIMNKLRQQLIFSKTPTFTTSTSTPALAPSQLGEMNDDQRTTVQKVLNAEDYALILGMPGTGKTTTIAHIIRALLAAGQTILLSSYTHTAVDNILLKIRDIAPPNSILRLGAPAKINAQVQKLCQLAATPRKTIEDVDAAYMGCRIVATTCLGTNHPIFNRRAFDVCIVDEASQITLPISLGPLLHARRFVLVGDHYQLPPLVQNRTALEGGLDVSLFRQLSEEHPEAVATLGKQYRMCEEIMTLSNTLIYDGKLECGNQAVANRQLQNVDLNALSAFHGSSHACSSPSKGSRCWLRQLCKPERKVIFANIDSSGKDALETSTTGKNITNHLEATLSAQLVRSLLAVGVLAKDIGVITLYRSQLALIKRLFRLAGIPREVDVDSADRFQGRDKECIILSMVRSNTSNTVGELLKDWRRVNVALTRAKSKLVIFGSRQTLKNNELLAKFLKLVDEMGWSIDLSHGVDSCHNFDFSSQTASIMSARKTPKRAVIMSPSVSPSKIQDTLRQSATRMPLMESPSVANRSPGKARGFKKPAKTIFGRKGGKAALQLEQVAFQIFEDLTGDDF